MRRIDIFISSLADVQIERTLAERVIRSAAAKFGVPVSVSYSNWLRRLRREEQVTAKSENADQEDAPLLCPCFWEDQDYLEHIPNTGQFDLVICLLWSRLCSRLGPTLLMPDGSRPKSATDYEVAWALDQSKRTPGVPALHIYRNRAMRAAPIEPKEKRELFCRQWDLVQECFAAWESNCGAEFVDCCHDYEGLEAFENLFRAHFRDFLTAQFAREAVAGKTLPKPRYWGSNPFRGLNFFDFEHAPIYHGRTNAIGEVLNALRNQAMVGNPLVLVLGPSGSGKSSLIRAGVLPLLTQGGTALGAGPWRYAVTRPGIGGALGDPFDTLAAALLDKSALPELQDAASANGRWSLTSELRRDPDCAANRIAETLDQLSLQELDQLLDQSEALPAARKEGVDPARQDRLRRVKPKMELALVVDQLEELFTHGFSQELQQRYIATLCALVRCERIFVIAALRSDFFALYHQFPELVELTSFDGRHELRPPTPNEIRNMIQLPAEAAGLRFEQLPGTGRSLDDALVNATIESFEPLPLLEQLLSQLYERQLERKDGLLRWSDYRELGEFQGALTNQVETVFLTLNSDEQQALKFVMPQLVSLVRPEERVLVRRTAPFSDLFSSPEFDRQQQAVAKRLVERLVKEGFLSALGDPRQELLVCITQEALLRRWPGITQWVTEDRDFLQMRDRLDVSLTRWLNGGRRTDGLLHSGIELAEGETLGERFRWSLSETQFDYIKRSLARQKRRRWIHDNIRLAATVSLAVLATIWAVEWFKTSVQLKQRERRELQAHQDSGVAANQPSTLEVQLKKAQEEARQAQQIADLAAKQRSATETQLKQVQEEKARLTKQNADLAAFYQTAPETGSQKQGEHAQEFADLMANQPEAGQIQPPNPSRNEKPAASTQPPDLPVRSTRP